VVDVTVGSGSAETEQRQQDLPKKRKIEPCGLDIGLGIPIAHGPVEETCGNRGLLWLRW
jgi:hypothetical protein